MRFSELFGGNKINDIGRLSNIGAVNFGKGITDKNEERTPHYEINRCIEMYESNAIVNSALNQLVLFLIPNRHIKISSKDKATEKFLEQWHKDRPGIIDEFRNLMLTNLICGNGPLEKHYAKTKKGKNVLDNVFSSNDMSNIFINPDDMDENGVDKGNSAYLFKLPIGIKLFRYMGKEQQAVFTKITYVKNYTFTFRMVYGIRIPFWKFSIYQSGWSRDNIYGRANLASAIDADNIYKEIMSSWDTIARTRQIDQKIITLADIETGINVDQERLDELGDKLEDPSSSYTLFNVPLKLLQQDVKLSGNYDLMEGVYDLLRRNIMMALLPQHLTPWSDSATTQGSDSAMPPFLGRLKAKQNEFIKFLNETIIDELRKTYPKLAEDASYVLDEPKVLADREYIEMISGLKGIGLINDYQAKLYLTRLGILDEDILNAVDPDAPEQGQLPAPEEPAKFEPLPGVPKLPDAGGSDSPNENFHREALNPSVGFPTFLKRVKERDPKVNTKGWKELDSNNIGGKQVRLVQSDDIIMLFDGLTLVDTYDIDNTEMKTIKQAFQDYKDKLKRLQDEYQKGKSEEDDIIDELQADIKANLTDKMNRLFKMLDKSKVKKEGYTEDFMSIGVLAKVTDFFSDFTKNMNKSVNNALKKLHLTVVDDKEDNIVPDESTEDLLRKKRDLMKKAIQGQVKQTKDKMLQDIKTTITKGIAAGRPAKDIKADIEKNFDFDRENGPAWKFDRIIRTDTRTASNIMKLKKWQAVGFEEYEWHTMEDEKVRDEHKTRNRKVYKIADALSGKDIFPGGSLKQGELNVNCRCRSSPY